MKYVLLILFLIGKTSFAQVGIVVKGDSGRALENVLVYALGEKNELSGITNTTGEISLKKDQNYLFHHLGYEEQVLKISKQDIVILKAKEHPLADVAIHHRNYDLLKLIEKPASSHEGYPDFYRPKTVEKVVKIHIDSAGYISAFKLFVNVQVRNSISEYSFILYSDDHGKPRELLIHDQVVGELKKKQLVFNTKNSNLYVEQGDYFLGFESTNAKAWNERDKEILNKDGWIDVPMIILRSERIGSDFIRYNKEQWGIRSVYKWESGKRTESPIPNDCMAYELELLVPSSK